MVELPIFIFILKHGSWGDGQKKHEKQESIKTNQILKMNLVIEL